jgi:HEAT repeat protein
MDYRSVMKLLAGLQRFIDIRPGELTVTCLLVAQSLFAGAVIAFYFLGANALFLSRLETELLPSLLPSAFIVSGCFGLALTFVSASLRRKVPFSRLQLETLLFLLLLVLSFSIGLHFTKNKALVFIVFACSSVIVMLLETQLWDLANRLLDIQQGKRLFILIAVGGSVSSIISFFVIAQLLARIGATRLLWIAASFLALSVCTCWLATRRLKHRIGRKKAQREAAAKKPVHRWDYYLWLLAAATVMYILTRYLIEYGFLRNIASAVKSLSELESERSIAEVLAWFFFTAKALDFIIKLLGGNWRLRGFGLRASLLALPVSLLLGLLITRALKSLPGSEAMSLLVCFATVKLLMFALRRSIFEPSFKLLYQPLPKEQRCGTQLLVDGIIKQGSVVLAGCLLLVFSWLWQSYWQTSLLINIAALLVVWLLVNLLLHQEYRVKLLHELTRRAAQNLTESPLVAIQRQLQKARRRHVQIALDLLGKISPELLNQLFDLLVQSEDPAIRRLAVVNIGHTHTISAHPVVEELAKSDPDAAVRVAAALVLRELGELRKISASTSKILLLASSAEAEDRQLAANALGQRNRSSPQAVLYDLLREEDPSIRRQALAVAGRTSKRELWPQLIESLSDGSCADAAESALVAVGEPVLDQLEVTFKLHDVQPRTMARILKVYERIGGARACELLFEKISYPSRDVQLQALSSLSALGFKAPVEQTGLVRKRVIDAVARIVWNLAAQIDIGTDEATAELHEALDWRIGQERDAILLLLSLVYDTQAILLIRDSLASEEPESRAFALEVAGEVLDADLAGHLLPIFDDVGPAKVLARLDSLCPHSRLSCNQRLLDIIRRGYDKVNTWTRACAIHALAHLWPEKPIPIELTANLSNPIPVIRELTAWAMYTIDSAYSGRHLAVYQDMLAPLLQEEQERPLLLYEKILILKQTVPFSLVPPPILVRIAEEVVERRLASGEQVFAKGEPGRKLFVVAKGLLSIISKGKKIDDAGPYEIVGEIAVLMTAVRTATVLVEQPARLLEIDQDLLSNILADHQEMLPGFIKIVTSRLRRFQKLGLWGPDDVWRTQTGSIEIPR